MSLNTLQIFNAVAKEFRANPSDEGFKEDFVTSVNQALDDLTIECDLSTPLSHIRSVDESISQLSFYHMGILKAGVVYYLIVNSWKHRRGDEMFSIAQDEWQDKIAQYYARYQNDAQRNGGIIGMGDLSDN